MELSERAANPNRWRGGVPSDDPDKLLIEAPDGEFWSPDTHRIAESVLANRLSDLHKYLLEEKTVNVFSIYMVSQVDLKILNAITPVLKELSEPGLLHQKE